MVTNHDKCVWQKLNQQEFTPEDIKRHVSWVKSHGGAGDVVLLIILIKLKLKYFRDNQVFYLRIQTIIRTIDFKLELFLQRIYVVIFPSFFLFKIFLKILFSHE